MNRAAIDSGILGSKVDPKGVPARLRLAKALTEGYDEEVARLKPGEPLSLWVAEDAPLSGPFPPLSDWPHFLPKTSGEHVVSAEWMKVDGSLWSPSRDMGHYEAFFCVQFRVGHPGTEQYLDQLRAMASRIPVGAESDG